MTDVFPLSSYIIWTIAVLWFGGMIWYLRQQVDIRIDKCWLEPDSNERAVKIIIVKGLMKARHKECLRDLYLCFSDVKFPQRIERGDIPESIDSAYEKFYATFKVPLDVLSRNKDVSLSAILPNSKWRSKMFNIPLGE